MYTNKYHLLESGYTNICYINVVYNMYYINAYCYTNINIIYYIVYMLRYAIYWYVRLYIY